MTASDELWEYIKSHSYRGPRGADWNPMPYYSQIGDQIEYYWEDVDCYADGPLFGGVVAMRAMDDSRIVGFKIRNVSELVGRVL